MNLEQLHEVDLSRLKKVGATAATMAALGTAGLYLGKGKVDQAPVTQVSSDMPQTQELKQEPKEEPVEPKDYGSKLTKLWKDKDPRSVEFSSGSEFSTILNAAERNNCVGDDFNILLAIRKSENGPPGREFGILHPKAIDTDLDTQAGWAAATIVKNRQRWEESDKSVDFITFLGNRYCPTVGDNLRPAEKELNKHWIKNVKFYYNKFSAY